MSTVVEISEVEVEVTQESSEVIVQPGGAMPVNKTRQITVEINSDEVLPTGYMGRISIPFSGIITGWKIFESSEFPIDSDTVMDIKKSNYTNYPTGGSITGSDKPTLVDGNKNASTDLDSFEVTLTLGDVLSFYIQSNTLAKNLLLTLTVRAAA